MPSRWTMRRNRRAQQAARICDCAKQGLPVQHERGSKVTVEERYHYHEHRRRHLEAVPYYDAAWERPAPETAANVYHLVRNFVPALDQIHPDPLTAMQLVTVALDVAVVSGRYGYRVTEHTDDPDERLRQVRRAVTRNTLSDAIIRRWSDHARLAREQKRAYSVTQMTETTARNCWRDLLMQEIKLPVLWKLVTIPNPLFDPQSSRFDVTRDAGTTAVTGYDITLRRGPLLRDFEGRVRRDRVYGPSRVRHTWRIWVVGKRRPPTSPVTPICAERRYNQVAIEDKTRQVLKLQENARLMLDSRMFVRNYRSARSEWRRVKREFRQKFPKIGPPFGSRDDMRRLQETKVKLEAFVWEYRSIYEQAVPLQQRRYPGTVPAVGVVPIRSAFYKVLNRRYQAAHFWLTQVSGHVDWISGDLDDDLLLAWLGSPRARWFSVPWNPAAQPRLDNVFALPWHLVSMDVSARQTQIQAILLGDEDMERDAILSREPHKIRLAKHAWDAHEAEDHPPMSEAELALALKMEQRIFRRAALKARTDLVANHETALQLIAEHERTVESLKAQFRQGVTGSPNQDAYGPLLVGYRGPGDKRLIEMMKNLWMVLGYGSSILDICVKQKKNQELYGQGWRLIPSREERLLCAKSGIEPKATTPDYHAILHVLCQVPGFQARETFLSSCQIAVSKHLQADPHGGIKMTDPLDGAEFEWNEPFADAVPLRLNEWDLMLVKPGYYTQPPKTCPSCRGKRRVTFRRRGNRWYCRTRECDYVWSPKFQTCAPDQHGRLVLDDKKLRKMVAPCLIHMLDSLFASYVVLALAEDGVRDFVSVHDCWFAPAVVYHEGREPEHGHVVLDRAIRAAGKRCSSRWSRSTSGCGSTSAVARSSASTRSGGLVATAAWPATRRPGLTSTPSRPVWANQPLRVRIPRV